MISFSPNTQTGLERIHRKQTRRVLEGLYSWPLNNMGWNWAGPLICKFFFNRCTHLAVLINSTGLWMCFLSRFPSHLLFSGFLYCRTTVHTTHNLQNMWTDCLPVRLQSVGGYWWSCLGNQKFYTQISGYVRRLASLTLSTLQGPTSLNSAAVASKHP